MTLETGASLAADELKFYDLVASSLSTSFPS